MTKVSKVPLDIRYNVNYPEETSTDPASTIPSSTSEVPQLMITVYRHGLSECLSPFWTIHCSTAEIQLFLSILQ